MTNVAIWNDTRNVETLKTMWGKGASASEIALALGHGCTRNMVIGKVHRLKLQKRDNAIRAKPSRTISGREGHRGRSGGLGQAKSNSIIHRIEGRKRSEAKGLAFKINQARKDGLDLADGMEAVLGGKKLPFQMPDEGVDATSLIAFEDRRIGQQCAWIPGDPLDGAMCCGKPVKEGTQWCPEHYARVYPTR